MNQEFDIMKAEMAQLRYKVYILEKKVAELSGERKNEK